MAGNWTHAYARTQKNITLSNAESEYVALVSGASEGLFLKAVIEHLTQEKVVLVVYGDNNSSPAIAQREGVGKLKHLSGRLLWLQQRQGRDLELRKLDAATNPSGLGAKALTGKRVNMLMFSIGFTNEANDLGKEEFEAQRMKADQRRRFNEVRKMVYVEEGSPEKSTQSNQLAKRLLRLTMTALLADSALRLVAVKEQDQCFPEDEPQPQPDGLLGRKVISAETYEQVVMGLKIAIVILSVVVLMLLKALKNMSRVELRRHENSWGTHRTVVGEEENYTSDDDQERIDLSLRSAGATDWQNWSNWPSGHQRRPENDETEDETVP